MSGNPSSASIPLDANLPWLTSLQRQLDAAIHADRLSHAILIQVSPGLGGEWLAGWLAARLFCTQAASRQPCGECLACRRVIADEQPDLTWLKPIEDSKEIRIDQVRELASELALTSHGGGRKIAIISPAEKLNRAAANALLKTLEEPSANSLLLLVTGEPSKLPVTVLSRCTRLQIPVPRDAELLAWLQAQGGKGVDWAAVLQIVGAKPLDALTANGEELTRLHHETTRALEMAAAGSLDPVETAENWGKDDYALRIACIESWLVNRVRDWARGQGRGSIQTLYLALDEAREARQWTDTPINKPLALERLLWRLNSLASGRAAATSRRPA